MNIFSRIKNKKIRDRKMAEITEKVNDLVANEPPAQFTKDYLEKAIEKARENSYEQLSTPRQRFIFDECVEPAIRHIRTKISDYWQEDKMLYEASRKQLDDTADTFIFQSHFPEHGDKIAKSLCKEEAMEIHIVFLHRLNGLLAPFSDETEEKLKTLKDEMLNITHQYV